MKTEKLAPCSGRWWTYCDQAASLWKMTGMHPTSMASKKDRRVGLSPGGCKQNTDWCIALSSTGGLLQLTSSVFPSIFTGNDALLICKRMIPEYVSMSVNSQIHSQSSRATTRPDCPSNESRWQISKNVTCKKNQVPWNFFYRKCNYLILKLEDNFYI